MQIALAMRSGSEKMAVNSQSIALSSGRPPLDGIIAAWVHAKASRSAETARAYPTVLATFRDALGSAKPPLDLDSADPRLAAESLAGQTAYITAKAAEQRELIDELVEMRVTAIVTVAQSWADAGDVKPATHNRRLAIVSSFYRYALKQGYLRGQNPLDRVERQAVQSYARSRVIPDEQLTDAWARLDRGDLEGQRDYALIMIGLHTGRRAAELAAMLRRDITATGAALLIEWPHCKGDKHLQSEIAANSIPAQALISWMMATERITEPGDPIWFSLANNGTYGQQLSTRAISRICERRLGESQVHKMRHTFAKNLERAGAPVSKIKDLLGHTNIATTGKYLASLDSGKNEYIDDLSALYGLK